MSNQTNRTRDKRIRTGSIALRIALGSALYLLLAFVVVDAAVLIVAGWPQIEQTGWRHEDLRILIPAMRDLLQSMHFDIVLKLEGVLVLLRLLGETL